MTPEQILTKAIEKAIANGWEPLGLTEITATIYGANLVTIFTRDKHTRFSVFDVIFSHDFAKALWGEKLWVLVPDSGPRIVYGTIWQHHLQQMVIAPDPIKYLGEHME